MPSAGPAERRDFKHRSKLAQVAPFGGYGHVVSESDRQAWQTWADGRAQAAFNRGQDALTGGDIPQALLWLDRAARIARGDPHVLLTLALAQCAAGRWPALRQSAARLNARWPGRESLGLEALACLRMGDGHEAARAMSAALSGFSPLPDTAVMAAEVARAVGAPGWCAASNTGQLLGDARGPVTLRLDGKHVGGGGAVTLPCEMPTSWRVAARLEVTQAGRPLLGSPIDLAALRRSVGCITPAKAGWEGWIWHPAEPEFTPVIEVARVKGDGALDVLHRQYVTDSVEGAPGEGPFGRPRGFFLPYDTLPDETLRVTDGYGAMLRGAPLVPGLARLMSGEQPRALPENFRPRRVGRRGTRPRLAPRPAGWVVIVPAYRHVASLRACLSRVLAEADEKVEVVVVDDASPEPAVVRYLDRLKAQGRITLCRRARNGGFPAAANTGLALARGRDVVLLNSDTLVPRGWLNRLAATLDRAPDIGTATPFSNDASILSYPSVEERNAVPDGRTAAAFDSFCASLGDMPLVDLPTANGFCMAIRGDCLSEVGLLREDLFAQGYGEENEFCLRATALGWRHVAAVSLFVTHLGSASFLGDRAALLRRNMVVLNALHPGYDACVQDFIRADPLAEARRRLDEQRILALARLRKRSGRPRCVAMLLHDAGGGVERAVRARSVALSDGGDFVVRVRPHVHGCRLEVEGEVFPGLQYALPEEGGRLIALLRGLGTRLVEWHHLVGHAPFVRSLHRELGVPYDIFVHDYASFCARVALIGPGHRYCGEPDVEGCKRCVAIQGTSLGEAISPSSLRRRSQEEFAGAGRVTVPSGDAASRLRRHFPTIAASVTPLEDDAAWRVTRRARRDRLRVGIVGGIGLEKGYDVVDALAQDARARRLPIDYILIGHTPDDGALLETGHVWVTGEYRHDEVDRLLAEFEPDIGFIPSIWPETWCYALGDLWRAGLPTAVFDIGAPADRVRETGLGWALPLAISPPALNDVFLRL